MTPTIFLSFVSSSTVQILMSYFSFILRLNLQRNRFLSVLLTKVTRATGGAAGETGKAARCKFSNMSREKQNSSNLPINPSQSGRSSNIPRSCPYFQSVSNIRNVNPCLNVLMSSYITRADHPPSPAAALSPSYAELKVILLIRLK